jgi:hypothetical protein
METKAITRKTLYDLILERGLRKVVQQINIKSHKLKYICAEDIF